MHTELYITLQTIFNTPIHCKSIRNAAAGICSGDALPGRADNASASQPSQLCVCGDGFSRSTGQGILTDT